MNDTTRQLLHDAMDALTSEDREPEVITAVTKRICEALGHQYPPYVGTGATEDDCPVCVAEGNGDFVGCNDTHMKPCCEIAARAW